MKVLFVSSGNLLSGISPIVKNQGESLKKNNIEIDYFTINGKGIWGYLKNVFFLKKYLKQKKFNLVHAHYSYSGIVAALSKSYPLVVSLMGSDVHNGFWGRCLIKIFNKFYWQELIVKTDEMKNKLKIKNAKVIPNGVNLKRFVKIENIDAKKQIGFNVKKKHIIFVANPRRREKNYKLAVKAYELLGHSNVELNVVDKIKFEDILYYYYASDVLLLTSLWEGSPNVVKEAMACNLPIVSTDVGDVKEIIGETEGCYVTTYDPEDVTAKLKSALEFGKRTNGKENINHLDSKIIAKKLIGLYEKILDKAKC